MAEKENRPECFEPEKDNPYPLCVSSADKKECKHCCLYVDFPEPPFDE